MKLRSDLAVHSFQRRACRERGTDLFSLVFSDRTHGNGPKLCQGRFRLDIRKHSFTERVKDWYRLLREMVTTSSLSLFKKDLDTDLNNILF